MEVTDYVRNSYQHHSDFQSHQSAEPREESEKVNMRKLIKKIADWVNDANHMEIDRNIVANLRNVRK